MPPARAVRQRVVNDENNENVSVATTRLTRAKAAALSMDDIASKANVQKPLAAKKSGLNANPQPVRKRAALGDVSNVTKGEAAEGKEGKKVASSKGLVSKAHPTGTHKSMPRATSKPVPASKDLARKPAAEKRSERSGSGAIVPAAKKSKIAVPLQSTNANTQIKKEEAATKKNEPVMKEPLIKDVKEEPVKDENKIEPEPVDNKAKTTAAPQEIDEVPDLDAEDIDDPLMVAEYVVEIFEYLKELEIATLPNADYMDHQEDLEWKMRGILVDWLIEVHTRFHLLPETLFLAVNIIDRFLSAKVVQLDRLQLVGVTAMFIASKYEEVLSPHVANFRHVADDGFTEAEILSAERYVLSALNYDLSYPNPMNFLRRISKADNYDIQTRTLGKYLMEISLLDHRFMSYLPSHVAASSMYLARMILERGEWDTTLTHYAGYNEEEIEPVFKLMVDYLARPVVHEAFFKKYASKKFLKASILTRQWAKRHAESLGVDVTTALHSSTR